MQSSVTGPASLVGWSSQDTTSGQWAPAQTPGIQWWCWRVGVFVSGHRCHAGSNRGGPCTTPHIPQLPRSLLCVGLHSTTAPAIQPPSSPATAEKMNTIPGGHLNMFGMWWAFHAMSMATVFSLCITQKLTCVLRQNYPLASDATYMFKSVMVNESMQNSIISENIFRIPQTQWVLCHADLVMWRIQPNVN